MIKEHPKPVSEVAPETPHDLEKLISRCLQKQPDRRWQAMADLRVALGELREESESGDRASRAGPCEGGKPLALGGVGRRCRWSSPGRGCSGGTAPARLHRSPS